jgi:hypothetical protein
MTKYNQKSISTLCAPEVKPAQQHASRIWSLTQMGAGMAGPDSRVISCVIEKLTDAQGNFKGKTPWAVIGEVQHHPSVSRELKSLEWRSAVTVDQITGLLYRKPPAANGFSNSWLDSGEDAIRSWVGTWGRVSSDHNAGAYRFEPLNLPGRSQPSFPDVDDLINELLADYVIDRLDHPVLQRLLNPVTPPAQSRYEASAALDIEEDNHEVY